jgi:hypothetical protein
MISLMLSKAMAAVHNGTSFMQLGVAFSNQL